jgi:hypothetical protein
VNNDFEITELASVHSMHGSTTGEDIFKDGGKTIAE